MDRERQVSSVFYIHLARRLSITWVVIGIVWLFFVKTPIGTPVLDQFAAFLVHLVR